MRKEPQDRDWIEQRLRDERPMHETPPGFTERVMAHLERRDHHEAAESARPNAWLRLATGFALATLVAVSSSFYFKETAVPPVAPAMLASEPVADPVPAITAQQVQALTLKLDQPLEKELENVISDTRQAIQFVASSFLPEK